MFSNNSNKKNNNLQKKSNNPVNISNSEYEEEYEFIQVNVATGDQYRKFANIRSKDGQITPEMVNKFHDESTKEARQWKLNNPRIESITFREARDENGKQVVKVLPTELIFPGEQQVKIYDKNGNQIVGEENIRREIEEREANWEQWEKEGKLQVVDHRTHDFADGSIATVYSRIAPVKLHENETNQISGHLDHLSKRLKILGEESKESGENNELIGSSQVKGKVVEIEESDKMDIDQSSKASTSKNVVGFSTETSLSSTNSSIQIKGDDLLTDEQIAKASESELTDLVERTLNELERRKAEKNTSNYVVSTKQLENSLEKAQMALSVLNTPTDDKPNNRILPVTGIVGSLSLLIGGLVFLKKSKNK